MALNQVMRSGGGSPPVGRDNAGMAEDKLERYLSMRNPRRTPEPMPGAGPVRERDGDIFVIQEHHATALHWDFRLERDGVLVSWAVPKGLPMDPGTNRLAVPTEDHPLSYADFEGTIRDGEYGGGQVILWDRGTFETEKWTEREVKVVLHGSRVSGRYVLFRTGGKNWMMHRMSPPPDGFASVPDRIAPMTAVLRDELPRGDADWAYEMKWDGVRAIVHVDGGRPKALSRNDLDITASYPELREMAESMGATSAVLDGELVALDTAGRPSFAALQARMHVQDPAAIRRLTRSTPVSYFVFDILHLDGQSTLGLPYRQRRDLLESLNLNGPSWRTPPAWFGNGEAVLSASTEQGLEGVMAKRVDSPYLPGRRSDAWLKIKNLRTQEVVIVGWKSGAGRREGMIGSLLVGIPGPDGLEYAGKVGTGFTGRSLRDLAELLQPLAQKASPLAGAIPNADAREAHWVKPAVVGEVRFAEWTRDGRLRHPAWRGLRPDKAAADVVRES